MEPDLLTTGEAAKILGVSRDRVHQLTQDGTLRALRTATGQRLFLPVQVTRLATRREQARAASDT